MKNNLSYEKNGPLIFILAAGVFGIINTEMGVVGILPLIAQKFGVSVSDAGWTVSIFALVVAFSGPVMPLLFSGVNRKNAMLLSLGVFIAANFISMLTPDFYVLLAARAIPAFFHPLYVSIAFTAAAASGGNKEAPKAVAKIFTGVSAGMVLGVPVTSFIAGNGSFEAAMLFFTLVNAAVFTATLIFMPSMPVKERLCGKKQLGVLKKPAVRRSIAAVTLINGAIFGYFSFMSDYLQNISGFSFKAVSLILFFYGAANIIGNIAAGRLLAQNAAKTIKTLPFVLTAAYMLLFFEGGHPAAAVLIISALGILAGIAANCNQYMLADSAPEAPDFANGLFLTSANLGTAAGTAVCGLFISGIGVQYALAGTVLFLAGSIVSVFLRYIKAPEKLAFPGAA